MSQAAFLFFPEVVTRITAPLTFRKTRPWEQFEPQGVGCGLTPCVRA